MNTSIPKITLTALWACAAVISIWFWASLADGLGSIILGCTALALEGLKLVTWQDFSRSRRALNAVLGIMLTALSLLASAGLTLDILNAKHLETAVYYESEKAWASQVTSLSRDRVALERERDRLPLGWVTARLRLMEGLHAVDSRLGVLNASRPRPPATSGGEAFRDRLGAALGASASALSFLFVAMLAVALELGIVYLAGSRKEAVQGTSRVALDPWLESESPKTGSGHPALNDDVALLWAKAYQGEGRPLRGRNLLEKERVLPPGRLRRAHRLLIRSGRVDVVGKLLFPKTA